MNFQKIIFLSAAALSGVLPAAALDLQVSAGQLSSLLTDEVKTANSLTLKGSMDKRDFDVLAEMPNLTSLNLADVTIEAYVPKQSKGMPNALFSAGALPPGALLGKHLTELVLPSGLKEIGQAALADNSFVSIDLPATLEVIGDNAFYGNKALTTINIPSGVKQVGSMVFGDCDALTAAVIHMPTTGNGTFMRCTSLTSLTLGNEVKSIGSSSFAGCSALASVALPSGLADIAEYAFTGTGLQTMTVPASVTSTGDYAFALCPDLKSVTFDGMPKLGEGLFFSCPMLEEVAFTDNSQPEEYPDYLFAGNSAMKPATLNAERVGRYAMRGLASDTLTIGPDVKRLDDHALEAMTSLKNINVTALGTDVPELGKDVFAGIDKPEVLLSTAEDCDEPWREAAQWKEFKIQAVMSVTAPDAEKADVRAYMQGSLLKVTSTDDILSLQVADPSGALLARLAPGEMQVDVDLAPFSAPVYIVVVKTAHTTATFKLTR